MPKLVNLGSLCVDNVYHVHNIARAGETVTSLGHETHPGGKGLNQSLAAARGGAEVVHVGCVGADGATLVDVLSGNAVDVSYIRTVEGPSGAAVIQVDTEGRNAIFITGGANRKIDRSQIAETMQLLNDQDWLLLQNEINDLELVLRTAADQNVKVAFNVAPVDGRERNYPLEHVQLLIVNEIEAMAVAQESDHIQAFNKLRATFEDMQVVLTLGGQGLMYGYGQESIQMPAFGVNVVDETAAGDAFIGFFMAAVLRGESTEQALREASVAGALAVTKTGAATSIPTLAEVTQFLSAT